MLHKIRFKIITILLPLLIVSFASLGVSGVSGKICPPGCPVCSVAKACCADIVDAKEASGKSNSGNCNHTPFPAKAMQGSSGCESQISGNCLGIYLPADLASVNSVPQVELVVDVRDIFPFESMVTYQGYYTTEIQQPILLKPPSIFIRNCSFLI